MNELDRRIRAALQQENADISNDMGDEPSVWEMLLETCRGRRRWLALLGAFWTLGFLVLGVLAAIQFFQVQDTRDQLMWAVATIMCMSAVSMLKIWYFMEINKNAITREIKRLELQIARLTDRTREQARLAGDGDGISLPSAEGR